jgi:hypothetical protein
VSNNWQSFQDLGMCNGEHHFNISMQKFGDPFNIQVLTITICKQLVHVQNFVLTTNNYQEFLLEILKAWGGIKP